MVLLRNGCSSLSGLHGAPIGQYHLAGFEQCDGYLLDAHGDVVAPPVWELFREAVALLGRHPTSIEWDRDIPGFARLAAEAATAQAVLDEAPR